MTIRQGPRQGLGELEQLVLASVLRVGEEAHGSRLRQELRVRAGRDVSPGTLYPTLDRLESKGLLTSRLGEPTPERGGRARRYFSLTPSGLEELRRSWRGMTRLIEGLEAVLDPERG